MKNVQLFEQFIKESAIFNNDTMDLHGAMDYMKERLDKENLPFYSLGKGALGNDTIFVLVSFEPKSEWNYGYVENSNYFRMSIYADGKMEVFTQSLYYPDAPVSYETRLKMKFRKSTAKSMKDAADRLIKFINDVKKEMGK